MTLWLTSVLLLVSAPSSNSGLEIQSCVDSIKIKLLANPEDLATDEYSIQAVYIGTQENIIQVESAFSDKESRSTFYHIPFNDNMHVGFVNIRIADLEQDRGALARMICEVPPAYSVKFHGWQFLSGDRLRAGEFQIYTEDSANAQTH